MIDFPINTVFSALSYSTPKTIHKNSSQIYWENRRVIANFSFLEAHRSMYRSRDLFN